MPHPEILRVLKMTKQEWGNLPPESQTADRKNLKAEGMALLAEEGKKKNHGLHDRIEQLEVRIRTLEKGLGVK